ncbi:hypothetical protein BGZ65_000677 [Modicella reniformis]|uniref:C2H2-type domain-containing protein n=1 Tax=Modicella reniformis TaxID=1440133 RepID=A0A9P6J2W1_9FUNG|nr:hypothetical protein BGZ65_000677 [Modicella reniformis]
MTSLEQFWTDTYTNSPDFNLVGAAVSSTPAQGSILNLNLGLTSPPPSLASTIQSGQNGSSADVTASAQDSTQGHLRLQAETALLDFVLFDDIVPPSPISTLSTPMTNSLSSVDIKEDKTNELALQLVAAAASMMNQPSMIDAQASDVIGSLFSDVDLSPSMEMASPITDLSGNHLPQEWTFAQMSQTFSFDFNNSSNYLDSISTTAAPLSTFSMQSSPMLPTAVSSPQLDLGILLSLFNQHQQQQQQQQQQLQQLLSPLIASMMPSLTSTVEQSELQMTETTSATNPLKRKSDDIANQKADDDESSSSSPRQFACSICGRAFSRLFNLNTHERTHDRSKARLFACPEQGCKKSFTRKNDLQRHQISIHGVLEIHNCQKCHKSFSRRDALRRHMGLKNCEDDVEPSSA